MSQELKLHTPRRPNVIWIFGDQHRAQALGCAGDPNVRTPVIDNLARMGRHFTCAVAGAPWCTPFRGALLTGLYPHQSGVIKTPCALDPALPTVAAPFRAAGYHTAWIGKWHLAGSNSRTHRVPPERRGGFDHWLGYENNNNQHECYVHGSGCEEPVRLDGYETDALTDLFIGHLRDHAAAPGHAPFFAVLSVQPPHNPYAPPTRPAYGPPVTPANVRLRPNVPDIPWVRERVGRDLSGYYGMVENLDWNIGRVTGALRDLDCDRDTWIVFFSDHGDMLGSHAQWEKSAPWEESVRIPFIISRVGGAEVMPTGPCDAVLNHVDIAPTSLGLCGIPVPGWMKGHDYAANCRFGRDGWSPDGGRQAEPESAFLQQIPRKFHPLCPNKQWRGVLLRDGWKYVCTPGNDWLLHNTREDPYEQANYVHNTRFQPERARCWDALNDWIQRTGDDFPLPPRDLPGLTTAGKGES